MKSKLCGFDCMSICCAKVCSVSCQVYIHIGFSTFCLLVLKVDFSLYNFIGLVDWDVERSVDADDCAFLHYMENKLGRPGM